MTITARYMGRCARCGHVISIGERIEWSRTSLTTHTICPVILSESPTQTPSTPSRAPFRCRKCGDTRDTTITGRCDDCDA